MKSPDRKPEISQNPSLKSVAETLISIPDINTLKRIISHPRGMRTVAALGLATVVAVTAITAGANDPVQAEGQTLPPNPISFIDQDVATSWLTVHGTLSFSGSGLGIDTIEVSKKGVYSESFQPVEDSSCYSEISQGKEADITVWGMVVNPAKRKGAIATATSDNLPKYLHPKGGEIVDLASPRDLSMRKCLTSEGLTDIVLRDDRSFPYYAWGTDASGDYLEQEIQNAVNPAKNGRFRLRLSAVWDSIGSWVKQQAYRLFLPINLQGYPS